MSCTVLVTGDHRLATCTLHRLPAVMRPSHSYMSSEVLWALGCAWRDVCTIEHAQRIICVGTCRDWARDMLVRVGTSWGMDDMSDSSVDTSHVCPRTHDMPVGTGSLQAALPLTRGPGGTFPCPVGRWAC